MSAIKNSFSVVLAGGWNPQIFTQNWISENLCENTSSEISFLYPVGNTQLPPRIEFENILLEATTKTLRFACNGDSLDSVDDLKKVGEVAKKTLELLIHTPINGMGVNFGFEYQGDQLVTVDEFKTDDSGIIESQYEAEIIEISRSLRFSNDVVLNLKTVYKDDLVVINFNFHHDSHTPGECAKYLTSDIIDEYYNSTQRLLRELVNEDD
ncbi:hypothetical protein OOT55_13875 [Marinimicrobium sp. C6131]|uniref:hypothetical protein n=1 Tax=Marinimicrobium sp. C6131 TaxID=3022676 RepID=UPI00223E4969|nr:hypothetical protein [Marinimicrobium sp. C6131]UZJ43736.1 hypothetical protein OOT55_13875 [Marinimicrobium sp. C6131]